MLGLGFCNHSCWTVLFYISNWIYNGPESENDNKTSDKDTCLEGRKPEFKPQSLYQQGLSSPRQIHSLRIFISQKHQETVGRSQLQNAYFRVAGACLKAMYRKYKPHIMEKSSFLHQKKVFLFRVGAVSVLQYNSILSARFSQWSITIKLLAAEHFWKAGLYLGP